MKNRAILERGGQAVLSGAFAPFVQKSKTIITGIENLPETGPVVYAPQHVNGTDPFYIGRHIRRLQPVIFSIAVKDGIANTPLIGPIVVAIGGTSVERRPSDGQSPEDRKLYIAGFAESLGARCLEYPDFRGGGMLFPEGTRHHMLTEIKVGPIMVASYMASQLDRPVAISPMGTANSSLGRLLKNSPKIGRFIRDENMSALSIGIPVMVDGSYVDSFIEYGKDPLLGVMDDVRKSLADASEAARASVGLEPLEYVGKVPTMKERKKAK